MAKRLTMISNQNINFHMNRSWSLLRVHDAVRYSQILDARKFRFIQSYYTTESFLDNLLFFVELYIMHIFYENIKEMPLSTAFPTAVERKKIDYLKTLIKSDHESGDGNSLAETLQRYIKCFVLENFFQNKKFENIVSRSDQNAVFMCISELEASLTSSKKIGFSDGIINLVSASADRLLSPHSKDFQGNTLLHIVAFEGNSELYSFLSTAGWSPQEQNSYGVTPDAIYETKALKLDPNVQESIYHYSELEIFPIEHNIMIMKDVRHDSKAQGVFNPVATTNDYEAPDWSLEDPLTFGNSLVAESGAELHTLNSITKCLERTQERDVFKSLIDELDRMLPIDDRRRPSLVAFGEKLNHESLNILIRDFVDWFIFAVPIKGKSKKIYLVCLAGRVLASALKRVCSILWILAGSAFQYVYRKIIAIYLNYIHQRNLTRIKENDRFINLAWFLSGLENLPVLLLCLLLSLAMIFLTLG
jgi:hypothetical protein